MALRSSTPNILPAPDFTLRKRPFLAEISMPPFRLASCGFAGDPGHDKRELTTTSPPDNRSGDPNASMVLPMSELLNSMVKSLACLLLRYCQLPVTSTFISGLTRVKRLNCQPDLPGTAWKSSSPRALSRSWNDLLRTTTVGRRLGSTSVSL